MCYNAVNGGRRVDTSRKIMKQISDKQCAHDVLINRLDINGILDRYFGKADEFELVSPFDRSYYDNEPYDEKYPYGKYKLNKSDADRALETVDLHSKQYIRQVYDEQLSAEQKASLPAFDVLCEEIKAECIAHDEKRKRGELGDEDSPFACDLVFDGKVKYCEPDDVFWHFYNLIGHTCCGDDNVREVLENLTGNPVERPLDSALQQPPYNELLPYLVSATPTFVWHCTFSGMLSIVFRFRFNEKTKAWLAKHYNKKDCFGYGLEDLAFYRGDELLFSQCTHEHFQNDFLEQFDD